MLPKTNNSCFFIKVSLQDLGNSTCIFVLLIACTDKELRNLASRLKDWFGALHEDANRVIKPTSSDTAQGSKKTLSKVLGKLARSVTIHKAEQLLQSLVLTYSVKDPEASRLTSKQALRSKCGNII